MKKSLILGLLLLTTMASAKGVYQTRQSFVLESFQGRGPAPSMIWLNKEKKRALGKILQHPYNGLRIRYWGKGRRTAWILEEIGKVLPITVGVIVEAGRIKRVKIMAFRESRGGEVRYPFFTDQFNGSRLNPGENLSKSIDGISGATLSVRAVKKLARMALYLHQQSPFSHAQK